MRRTHASFFLIVCCIVLSCQRGARAIVGDWRQYTSKQYDTGHAAFFKDGSGFFEDDGRRIACKWEPFEGKRAKIEVEGLGMKRVAFADVNGDELILDSGDERSTWVRSDSKKAHEMQKAAADATAKEEQARRTAEAQEEGRRQAQARNEQAENQKQQQRNEAKRLLNEGMELLRQRMYDQAIVSLRQSADLGQAEAQNNLSWFLATTPQTSFQNGKFAIDYALKATAQFPDSYNYLDTLAAAYARDGRFDDAMRAQARANALARDDRSINDQQRSTYLQGSDQRMIGYRQSKPYTEGQ